LSQIQNNVSYFSSVHRFPNGYCFGLFCCSYNIEKFRIFQGWLILFSFQCSGSFVWCFTWFFVVALG
jgi:hypothetical protein